MNFLCLLMLLTTIWTNVVGHTYVQIVDVTCERRYDDPHTCTIDRVNYRPNTPNILNIQNDDATIDVAYFEMTNGLYTAMPLNLFRLFPKLKKLEISTGLKAITNENLIGGKKLIELALPKNKIKEIKTHTFDGMDKLVLINLSFNDLTKIESNAFAGAINLKTLDLSWNGMFTSAIEDGAFNIQTLEEINLSHNNFRTLPDNVFIRCPDLKDVYLYGNKLTRIGNSIDNIPKLSLISFNSDNVRIVDFDFDAIARKPHLKDYFCGSIALTLDHPATVPYGNYTAERLDISGNDLLYPDILQRLRNFRNLEWLNIGHNDFRTIDDIENILDMFPKLYGLEVDQLPCKYDVIERLRTKFGDRIIADDSIIHFFD